MLTSSENTSLLPICTLVKNCVLTSQSTGARTQSTATGPRGSDTMATRDVECWLQWDGRRWYASGQVSASREEWGRHIECEPERIQLLDDETGDPLRDATDAEAQAIYASHALDSAMLDAATDDEDAAAERAAEWANDD